MKVSCITDQHFGARNDSLVFSNYFRKFYKEVFFPYIDANNIRTIIDLGDTFDHRKYINYNILDKTNSMWFDQIAERGLQLHALVGNHDAYFKNTNGINSVGLLSGQKKNVFTYDKVEEVEIDGLKILFIPWINPENIEESLQRIEASECKVGFGHLEINGFQLNSTMIAKQGLNASLFNKFDSMYTGHFHKKSDNGTIFYLGTPYQINWNDYGETKGFHVFDTVTLEMEFIPNPNSMFEKIFYDDSAQNFDDFDVEPYDQKIIKVIVTQKTDLYKFDRFLVRLYNDIDAVDINVIEASDFETSAFEELGEVDDTLTLINRCVESIESSSINTYKLQKRLTDLYSEASELI
jgi:DNA repair exonuclease SbcCD nuclease subunit